MAIFDPAEGDEELEAERRQPGAESQRGTGLDPGDLGHHAPREPRPPPFETKTAAAFSITLKGWSGIAPGLITELLTQAADRIEALWRKAVWEHIYEAPTAWAQHRAFALPKSFVPVRAFSKNEVRLGFTSDSVYADVQDKGRVVVPVSPMKSVAIPLTSAHGVAGLQPSDFGKELLKRLYNWKTGITTLVMPVGRGKDAKGVPMFVLKPAVTIPPKKYLERADEDVESASPAVLKALLHGMAIKLRVDKVDNFEIDTEGGVKQTTSAAEAKPARPQVVLRKGGGRK